MQSGDAAAIRRAAEQARQAQQPSKADETHSQVQMLREMFEAPSSTAHPQAENVTLKVLRPAPTQERKAPPPAQGSRSMAQIQADMEKERLLRSQREEWDRHRRTVETYESHLAAGGDLSAEHERRYRESKRYLSTQPNPYRS